MVTHAISLCTNQGAGWKGILPIMAAKGQQSISEPRLQLCKWKANVKWKADFQMRSQTKRWAS